MELNGFLVLSTVSEAERYWKEIPVLELISRVEKLIDEKEAEEKEKFERFLRESESEEVQRRIGLIKEFEEIGIDGNDSGILYLKDLIFRQFEEESGVATLHGIPAPHLNGLREIWSDLLSVSCLIDPADTFSALRASGKSNSFPREIPYYFDQMIELNSHRLSLPFPMKAFENSHLEAMARHLQRNLLLTLRDDKERQTPSDPLRTFALPVLLPEDGSASHFYRLDRKSFQKAYLSLVDDELGQVQEKIPGSDSDKEQITAMIYSLMNLSQTAADHPDWDVLLSTYQEE